MPTRYWLEVAEEVVAFSRKRGTVDDYKRRCNLIPPEPGKDRYFRLKVLGEMLQQGLVRIINDRLSLGAIDAPSWLTAELLNGDGAAWAFVEKNFSETSARKFDDQHLKEIGLDGESWVVSEYRHRLPDSMHEKVIHVSLKDDTAGFDIVAPSLNHEAHIQHMEVKTSVRRTAYFEFHISRNEYEIGASDERWVLLLVKKEEGSYFPFGHLFHSSLVSMVPKDVSDLARWQSVRIRLSSSAVFKGLP